jgi:hypothetical protein
LFCWIFGILAGPFGKKEPMDFKVGNKVIYPAHGTAEVTGRSTKVVDGKKVKYLELSVAAGAAPRRQPAGLLPPRPPRPALRPA